MRQMRVASIVLLDFKYLNNIISIVASFKRRDYVATNVMRNAGGTTYGYCTINPDETKTCTVTLSLHK